jgi:hypothetical protein
MRGRWWSVMTTPSQLVIVILSGGSMVLSALGQALSSWVRSVTIPLYTEEAAQWPQVILDKLGAARRSPSPQANDGPAVALVNANSGSFLRGDPLPEELGLILGAQLAVPVFILGGRQSAVLPKYVRSFLDTCGVQRVSTSDVATIVVDLLSACALPRQSRPANQTPVRTAVMAALELLRLDSVLHALKEEKGLAVATKDTCRDIRLARVPTEHIEKLRDEWAKLHPRFTILTRSTPRGWVADDFLAEIRHAVEAIGDWTVRVGRKTELPSLARDPDRGVNLLQQLRDTLDARTRLLHQIVRETTIKPGGPS